MILFSKPFFACAGVAAVFLAVLCLACFLCALCPNGWIFRIGCLGVCFSRLPTPAWLEFISARVVLALCARSHKNWPRPPTRFQESASIPGRVYAPTVAVRALERVSAQLSTSARARWQLARRGSAPRGRASSDGWAASGVKLRARGRPGGPWRALTRG